MANEVVKITDQNGVDHPIKDLAAFPRSEQAVLGAVNELDNTAVSTGIFTVNANKSVLVNGSTSSSWGVLNIGIIHPKAGHYLKGCPAGGGGSTYKLQAQKVDSSTPQYQDFGSGVIFTEDSNDDYVVSIVVGPNQSIDNKLFEPMVSTSLLAPYAPYAMTNRELTEHCAISVTDIKTDFKTLLLGVTGSTVTDVETAYVTRYGKLMILNSRINKAANTAINMNVTVPYTLIPKIKGVSYVSLQSPFGAGTASFGSGGLALRYNSSDAATYVDLTFTAIVDE